MAAIKEIKLEVRHREWAEQIQECQNSRLCEGNSVNSKNCGKIKSGDSSLFSCYYFLQYKTITVICQDSIRKLYG